MAIYHLTARTSTRARNQSAAAKAAYVTRSGRYGRPGRHDPALATGSGNMPAWAQADPMAYWRAADRHERANGRLCREVEVALPRELSRDQQQALARQLIERVAGRDLPWTAAIHAGGGTNPHLHLVVSERQLDGSARCADTWFLRAPTGARKTDRLKPRAWLQALRADWARMANDALAAAGHHSHIDHRSLAAQGVTDRLPGAHRGPTALGESRRLRAAESAEAVRPSPALVRASRRVRGRAAAQEEARKRASSAGGSSPAPAASTPMGEMFAMAARQRRQDRREPPVPRQDPPPPPDDDYEPPTPGF